MSNLQDEVKPFDIKIVALGGGHGLGRLLSALSFMGDKLSAIVTTSDNGGSTGRLRQESGCIGWGDLRQCINQLCHDNQTIASQLFEYRFQEVGELSGHNLGNLMLLALDDLSVRPLDAIETVRRFLRIRSRLIPMSEVPVHLVAKCGRREILGEVSVENIKQLPDSVSLEPICNGTAEAIATIESADVIIIGPGSFITSVIPPLLPQGINQALRTSQATKVLIGNLGNDHHVLGQFPLSWMLDFLKELGIEIDKVIWPTSRISPVSSEVEVLCSDFVTESGGLHRREQLITALESALNP